MVTQAKVSSTLKYEPWLKRAYKGGAVSQLLNGLTSAELLQRNSA